MTPVEYLRRERLAETKSEFVDGEIFAMSGGSPLHSLIAANWIWDLKNKLRGRNCHVFTSDLRIRTHRTGAYVYPDVSVVCGRTGTHRNADDILTNPIVVIEVLSPSTADYDRGKKFGLYREIASLQDYLLVTPDSAHVEHYSRQPESWLFREYSGIEATVHIASIECAIALRDIYDGVLEPPAGSPAGL